MSQTHRYTKHVIQWLIAGSRGGVNRGKILSTIKEEPMNANQLSEAVGVDYRTIRHHLDVLEKNGMITSMGPRYGTMYFVSQNLEACWDDFEEIWNKIGKTPNSDGD
ncbi:MAG: ArsR/SmtB family transcription factor [archaeon]